MRTKTVDVLVAGGGTAGVIAGLAASRNGAKTVIVDKQRCLGGQFTAGMQGAWVGFSDKMNRIVGGIAWELRNIFKERNAIVEVDPETDVCFLYDTEVAKVILDEVTSKEPNLECFLDTAIVDVIQEGDAVVGLVVLSQSEMMEIRAKVVIDPAKAGMNRDEVILALRNGTPSIEVLPSGEGAIFLTPMTLADGEEQIVLERLLEILTKQRV